MPGRSSPLPQQSLLSDSPSAKLWSVYVAKADRQDRALASSWKGNMDALLIFAGLFSAIITAFLVESYQSLTPDPNLIILGHISLQLAAIANGTHLIQPDHHPVPFEPSFVSILCNFFWFLSLAFSLASALAATLVEQWTRNYFTAVQKHPAPQIRARVRAYLYQGLQQFGMSAVVETIPTLLHISLFLFLAGRVAFLYPINSLIRTLCLAILVVCTMLYAIVTFLPIVFHQCPYRTPFTTLYWRIWQAVLSHTRYGFETPPTMSAARELSAVVRIPARDARDKEALCRTVGSLSDGGELAAFIEGIPGFLIDGSSGADIMKHILRDKNLNLGLRIIEQLHYRNPSEAVRGAISCLGAIWHILVYCVRRDSPVNDVEEWFDEETLPVFETLFYEGPIVGHYLWSTTALFTSSILSSYMSSAKSIERELRRLGVELPWTIPEPRLEQIRVTNYLLTDSPDVTSGCIMALKKWLFLLHQDFTAIKADMERQSPPPTDELMQSLWAFQTLVNEAQITIYNDFLTKLLSDFPPYEALVTFYRLDCDYDPSLSVSLYNQTRLVDFLRAYEDISSVAFEQLLDDVVILDDYDLINEARDIVADYLNVNPDNKPALRASSILTEQKDRQRPSIIVWKSQIK